MAGPLAPVAGIALKYAVVAAAGYVLARSLPSRDPDPRAEAALDDLPEGLAASACDEATRASWRWRGTVRLGTIGARIDAGLLARLRVNRA